MMKQLQITSNELLRRFGEISLERDQLSEENYRLDLEVTQLKQEIENLKNAPPGVVPES